MQSTQYFLLKVSVIALDMYFFTQCDRKENFVSSELKTE